MKQSLVVLSIRLCVLFTWSLAGGLTASADDPPPQAQFASDGLLTLPRALELALLHSPDLAASSHEARAAEGLARQAGAWPNPELAIEAEEFGGSAERKGFESAQTTLSVSQSLELGGKRGQRQRVAQADARLAGWAYEAKRREVLAETKKSFVDVLVAQGQLALAQARWVLAEEVRQAVAERVKAGKVPQLEETKASVELVAARIARDRAERELATARERLAAHWGGTQPGFKEAEGRLDSIQDLPPLETLSAWLESLPALARWSEEVTRSQQALALAKAERMPTLEVSAGLRRYEDDGSYAGVAGLSLPLPLFDRNAGGLLAAEHQAARTEAEQRAARLRATTELVEACRRLDMARAEALAIQTELLPGAQQAFDAAQTGYREGKFGYLDVLDTQRTLNETRARSLEVLAEYQKAAVDVERLTGASLNTL